MEISLSFFTVGRYLVLHSSEPEVRQCHVRCKCCRLFVEKSGLFDFLSFVDGAHKGGTVQSHPLLVRRAHRAGDLGLVLQLLRAL